MKKKKSFFVTEESSECETEKKSGKYGQIIEFPKNEQAGIIRCPCCKRELDSKVYSWVRKVYHCNTCHRDIEPEDATKD